MITAANQSTIQETNQADMLWTQHQEYYDFWPNT